MLFVPFVRENGANVTLFVVWGLVQVGDCLDGVIHTHPSCDLIKLGHPCAVA